MNTLTQRIGAIKKKQPGSKQTHLEWRAAEYLFLITHPYINSKEKQKKRL
jgi:hypothetical protein